jgi:tetratricopeptide (TPR) repeat protein
MQPSKLSIAELFQNREQYLIPLFQRGYVWTLTHQIQPLWEDIVDRMDALKEHRDNAAKVGGVEKLKPMRKHFLGAIVVGSPVGADSEVIPTREVIDGQQRITTLQIMLFAFRDVLKPYDDEALNDDIRNLTYNKGKYRSANDHLKVWPTNVGRDVMKVLESSGDLTDEAIRLDPRASAAFSKRGSAYYAKGDLPHALADLNQAIALDMNNADAIVSRGTLRLEAGDPDRAIVDFNAALLFKPTSAVAAAYVAAFRNRGTAFAEKGDLDHAIADCSEAIRLNPEDAEAFRNRAAAYEAKGDLVRAAADRDAALHLESLISNPLPN